MNVLVLGFYDRKNIGDDSYKLTIPILLKHPNINLTFQCMDDIKKIPTNTDIVICGGGDIINKYFMEKATKLLNDFAGPVYALSVGIPYVQDKKYLHLFDHVFMRSVEDYIVACSEIGSVNASVMIDSAFCIPKRHTVAKSKKEINIGLCLAQPVFWNNPKRFELIDSIINFTVHFAKQYKKAIIHLLSFNHNTVEESECDILLNNEIMNCLAHHVSIRVVNEFRSIKVVNATHINTPLEMLDYMKKLHINICMRYHSIIFSLMNKLKFVSLSTTPKNMKILNDVKHPYNYYIPVDDKLKPLRIDENAVFDLLNEAISHQPTIVDNFSFSRIPEIIHNKKLLDVPIITSIDTFSNILLNCEKALMNYFNISEDEYEKLLHNFGKFDLHEKDPHNVARLISYNITGNIQNPFIWGLASNIQGDNFKLYEAVEYIYNETKKTIDSSADKTSGIISYYPNVPVDRKVFANIDCMFKDDFRDVHRSGWAYAVDGLMNLNAVHRIKKGKVSLDTFIDRSFHWGCETLKAMGIIPYRNPWVGIIHHTFDETHSKYNCTELFKNNDFIESLKKCRGLIALTEYLAKQLRNALDKINMNNVQVFVVPHPMESVHKLFSMNKFITNEHKKIINIGAWLRNPYTIYQLQLIDRDIQKCSLKGKHMEQYFTPADFIENVEKFLSIENKDTNKISPMFTDCICRPNYGENKYCMGLYEMIKKNESSVKKIEHVSNDEYDDLLTENLVFLDLIDCSAVNTVLECLVRNTPLIVNRHPAVEEVLGKEYPGFYDNLIDVALIVHDQQKIRNITHYLSCRNKEIYRLDYFVSKIQDVLLSKIKI